MAVPAHMITPKFVAPFPEPEPVAAPDLKPFVDSVLVDGFPVRLEVIALSKVHPPKDELGKYINPRRVAPMPIAELVESLRTAGQKEPIRVFEKDGVFYLLDGDRRLQAARKLGWTSIVALVLTGDLSVDQIRQYMLLSDVRQHLPPSAVASSIVSLRLADPLHWTETRLASFLGKPASAIPVLLALADAPESVRKAVDTFEATGGANGMSLTAFKQLMNRPRAQQDDITARALAAAEKKGKPVTVAEVRQHKADVLGTDGPVAGFGLLDSIPINPALDHLNEATAYISQHGNQLSTSERAQLYTAARSVLAALSANS